MLQNKEERGIFSKMQISAPLCTLAVFFMIFLSDYISQNNIIPQSNKYLAFVILQIAVFVIPCSFLAIFVKDARAKAYKIKAAHKGCASFTLLSTVLLIVAVTLVKYICTVFFKSPADTGIVIEKESIWFYILAVCLIPAVFEELFFRGVIFSLYEKKSGAATAILATSLLFALFHFSLVDFLPYLTAGLIIGFAVHLTNSIFSAILMHFVSNTVSIFLNNAIFKFAKDGFGNTLVIILLLALLLLVLSFCLGRMQKIYLKRAIALSKETQDKQSAFSTLFEKDKGVFSGILYTIISPPFILCVIFFIVYTL